MRGEVLGAERRRRWTAEQKARIVAESFGSGEPVSWVAPRHDLSTSQLFTWRKAAKDGTDAGLAAVTAAFLHVEIADEHEDGSEGYIPPVLPPYAVSPEAAGSVVPFRRLADGDGPGPAEQPLPADPSPPGGSDDDVSRIEAVLPDGVVLRLPDDVALDRLAALVQALRS